MNKLRAELADAAHIWWATPEALDDLAGRDQFEAWLTPDEDVRYRRFRVEDARRLFLYGRAVLRHTLSRYADVAPQEWRFVLGEYGRPELAPAFEELGLRFNLSHTSGLVVCLVNDGIDGGVDVEALERATDPIRVAPSVFSSDEQRQLAERSAEAARARFFEIWTLKEAYIKAVGQGLALPVKKVSFGEPAAGSVSVSFEAPIQDNPRDWQFSLWRPSDGHQGAVAFRRGDGPDRTLRFKQALTAL